MSRYFLRDDGSYGIEIDGHVVGLAWRAGSRCWHSAFLDILAKPHEIDGCFATRNDAVEAVAAALGLELS